MTITLDNTDNHNLKEFYKFVYECVVCKTKYGTDDEEKGKHFCPIHDPVFGNNRTRLKK